MIDYRDCHVNCFMRKGRCFDGVVNGNDELAT